MVAVPLAIRKCEGTGDTGAERTRVAREPNDLKNLQDRVHNGRLRRVRSWRTLPDQILDSTANLGRVRGTAKIDLRSPGDTDRPRGANMFADCIFPGFRPPVGVGFFCRSFALQIAAQQALIHRKLRPSGRPGLIGFTPITATSDCQRNLEIIRLLPASCASRWH